MLKQLITFNGGVSTKVAPHLIKDNQGVSCSNIDLDKGSIYPLNGYVEIDRLSATGHSNVYYKDRLVSSDLNENRDYATFGNRLYYTNGNYVKDGETNSYGLYRWTGTESVSATSPSVDSFGSLSLVATDSPIGVLSADYAYTYTFIGENGVESLPSPISNITVSKENVQITIGSETNPSVTVAKRRIYRTGGSNPTFNLVAEIDATETVYTDKIRDLDISRIELSSFDASAPPVNLSHLVEANGTMWGSVEDKVYFSNNGRPENWSKSDFIILDDVCTGVGVFRDNILAFTENNTYLIGGFNRDNVYLKRLPYTEGCLKHESISNVTDILMWTSRNGICAYNGSEIKVVTRNILDWVGDTRTGDTTFDGEAGDSSFDSNVGFLVETAFGFDGKYYALHQNGLGVIDTNNGFTSYNIDSEYAKDIFYDYIDNVVCVVAEDLRVLGLGVSPYKLVANWKTGELHQGDYSLIKSYKKVEFNDIVNRVIVYIDGKMVQDKSNIKKFFLKAGSKGRSIQLDIYTDREIRSVQVKYGMES